MHGYEKINSRNNQRLTNARKVRDGSAVGLIFVEGKRLAREALLSNIEVEECFFASDLNDDGLLDEASSRAINTYELSPKLFASIADTKNPQGIILIGKRPDGSALAIEKELRQNSPIVLFLKEINNPSNLGAILRTAEASGVAGVVISKRSADVYSPKALRAAMGSSFRLALWEEVDFTEVLAWAKERKLTTTATDVGANKIYSQVDLKIPRLLIFGSEAHGLTREEINSVDETIVVPMENGVESLNLAVAAGIILFEGKRQNT